MITFEQARAIVAGADSVREIYPPNNFHVADYGWENADEYLVVAGTSVDIGAPIETSADFDMLTMDAPVRLVSKQTGELRQLYGTCGDYPTDDMTPIGDAPEYAGDD